MLGARGNADARAHVDDVAVERHPDFERAADRLGDALRIARPAAGHHDRELVAADAGDAVRCPTDDGPQPRRHLAQQQVADRMTERRVDVIELSRSRASTATGDPARAAAATACSSRSVNRTRVGRPVSASRCARSVIRETDAATPSRIDAKAVASVATSSLPVDVARAE